MKFGASLALTAADDPALVRDFAQTVDQAGFDVLTVSGHLLAADSGRYADRPSVTYTGPFHDPFVLFGYLAGITQRVHFRPNILILPLYATAIVAKQAAELQLLSGGRFELGVGLSWNPAEYAALGQDFSTRGRRLEEQIEVLRKLWTEPLVTYQGRWHNIDALGLNRLPDPVIPIWIGATTSERPLRRVARLADGFAPLGEPAEPAGLVRQFMREYGRDPSTLALAARIVAGPGGPDAWVEATRALDRLGVTHVSIGVPPDLGPAQALERVVDARRVLADAFVTQPSG
jgi:probable F420-dependent oxidoreductase